MSQDEKQPLPEGMSISLVGLEGEDKGATYRVESHPAYIGSDQAAEVVFAGHRVADFHARLVVSSGDVFLEDLGSGPTARVNDREVKRLRLKEGDIIELGGARLLLQLSTLPGKPRSARPDRAAEGHDAPSIWAAGFSEGFREWFEGELAEELSVSGRCFTSGEDLLISLSRALSRGEPPSVLFLDLRLPLINGVNSAIAARAFELGYNLEQRTPIVFLFPPPESTGFSKVVRFCQPLRVVEPGDSEESEREAAAEAARAVLFPPGS